MKTIVDKDASRGGEKVLVFHLKEEKVSILAILLLRNIHSILERGFFFH